MYSPFGRSMRSARGSRRGLPLLLIATLFLAPASATQGQARMRATLIDFAGLDSQEQRALEAGEVISRAVDSAIGHESISAHIVRVQVPPAQVAAVYAERGFAVETASAVEFGRLDDPDEAPEIGSLAELSIDDNDLGALSGCSPGRCKVKLPRGWIHQFRGRVDWGEDTRQAEAERLYAALLAEYVDGYRRRGNAALATYQDKRDPVSIAEQFGEILESASILCDNYPALCRVLRDRYANEVGISTSLHWQKEDIGARRKVTTLVEQVRYVGARPGEMVVASKQLYANHYYEGALALTWIGPAEDADATIVVHVLWARVDALRGWSLFRGRIHSGIRNELGRRVGDLRDRLESHWASLQEDVAR